MHDRLDALYDALIAALPGSAARPGQRQMMHAIASALDGARFGFVFARRGIALGQRRLAIDDDRVFRHRRADRRVVLGRQPARLGTEYIWKPPPCMRA